MNESKPVTGYRMQIIGLDPDIRANFLAACKKNGVSGSSLLRQFMADYAKQNA
jgi:hypothetical protein